MTDLEQALRERDNPQTVEDALAQLNNRERVLGMLHFLDGQTANNILIILGVVCEIVLAGNFAPKHQAIFLNKLQEHLFGTPDPEKAV